MLHTRRIWRALGETNDANRYTNRVGNRNPSFHGHFATKSKWFVKVDQDIRLQRSLYAIILLCIVHWSQAVNSYDTLLESLWLILSTRLWLHHYFKEEEFKFVERAKSKNYWERGLPDTSKSKKFRSVQKTPNSRFANFRALLVYYSNVRICI